MSRLGALLLGGALAAGLHARAEDVIYYAPVAFAFIGSTTAPNGVRFDHFWSTSLSAFNNGETPARVIYRNAYGKGATILTAQPGCNTTYPTPFLPYAGRILERGGLGGCVYPLPIGGPGFVEISASPGLVFNAQIERFAYTPDCGGSNGELASQGHAQLPVYKGLFPAGATVTSGDIDLGSPTIDVPCTSENQKYLRRVNLTLFNAGDQPALFTVKFWGLYVDPRILLQQTYTLSAKEVRQIDRVPLPALKTLPDDNFSVRIWMSITANQPFLSYVSTVFEDGEPGSMPFEVYPSRMGTQ